MKASGLRVKLFGWEWARPYILMALTMKDGGVIIRQMDWDGLLARMEICMRGRGKMIWLMDTVYTLTTKMVQSTRDNGSMTYAMVRVRRYGMTVHNMKAYTRQVRRMA